jgi:hypothetical protein
MKSAFSKDLPAVFYVRFEVFTAVTMKNGVFWNVTPCGSKKAQVPPKRRFLQEQDSPEADRSHSLKFIHDFLDHPRHGLNEQFKENRLL